MAHMYETRDEYSSALDDVEAKLNDWKQDLDDMTDEEREEAENKLDELERKLADFRENLEDSTSDDDSITDDINEAWNDLKREVDDLMD